MKLTENPTQIYLNASELGRRLLNQMLFTEIRVRIDDEVNSANIAEPYDRLIPPRVRRRRGYGVDRLGDDNPGPEKGKPRPDFFETEV